MASWMDRALTATGAGTIPHVMGAPSPLFGAGAAAQAGAPGAAATGAAGADAAGVGEAQVGRGGQGLAGGPSAAAGPSSSSSGGATPATATTAATAGAAGPSTSSGSASLHPHLTPSYPQPPCGEPLLPSLLSLSARCPLPRPPPDQQYPGVEQQDPQGLQRFPPALPLAWAFPGLQELTLLPSLAPQGAFGLAGPDGTPDVEMARGKQGRVLSLAWAFPGLQELALLPSLAPQGAFGLAGPDSMPDVERARSEQGELRR